MVPGLLFYLLKALSILSGKNGIGIVFSIVARAIFIIKGHHVNITVYFGKVHSYVYALKFW